MMVVRLRETAVMASCIWASEWESAKEWNVSRCATVDGNYSTNLELKLLHQGVGSRDLEYMLEL
jgi:hypothetical protein